MTLIEMFVGNRSPSLTSPITANGRAFDLSGSTVRFRMRAEATTTLVVDQPATIVSATGGLVQYDWATPDVANAGRFQGWFQVTLPSTLVQDSPEFPIIIKQHVGSVTQIDIDSIRDHVETGIVDSALQVLLDDAQAQVESRFGTDASITLRVEGQSDVIRLQRAALTITTITESDDQRVLLGSLSATDYELSHGGKILKRLSGGVIYYWGQWAPVVDIVYVPRPEQILRDRVVVDLVKLAVQYNALEQENVGGRTGYITNQHNYLTERERILNGVAYSRGFRFA